MNEKFLEYSINLLSSRDYSRGMLEEKITKKFSKYSLHSFPDQYEIDEVLNFLEEKKYLDDYRTGENFIRYRKEFFPRGRIMIRQDMVKKKYSYDVIDKLLEKNFSYEDEIECAKIIAEKKMLRLEKEEDTKKKQEKFFRFMASKGFNFSIIGDVWEEVRK